MRWPTTAVRFALKGPLPLGPVAIVRHICRTASTIHCGALCIPIRSVAKAINTTLWHIVPIKHAPKGHGTLREHFLEDVKIPSKDSD